MSRPLTQEELNEAASDLGGTTTSMATWLETNGIADVDDLDAEAQLEDDCGLVICSGCGYWTDAIECEETDNGVFCDDCRDSEEKDE